MNDLDHVEDMSGLRNWLDEYCKSRGRFGWHHYGAADQAAYDESSPRIMLVNSESGGYSECESTPSTEYIRWIVDRHRTPRYGALLVTLIRLHVEIRRQEQTVPSFERAVISTLYQDTDALVESMRGTIYMNARIGSNDKESSNEDKGEVIADALEFARFRRRLVQITNPEIVICGGDSAAKCLFTDNGAFDPNSRPSAGVSVAHGKIFVMTAHLSKPQLFGGYANLHSLSEACADVYVGCSNPSSSTA